jgi:hypothetical protein
MFDSAPPDLTQLSDPPAIRTRWEERPRTPLASSEFLVARTEFVTSTPLTLQWQKSPASDLDATRPAAVPRAEQTPAASDLLSKTISDRSRLLAQKYGSGAQREELLRLDILTERLRSLSPRVGNAEVDALTEVVDGLELLVSQRSALEAEYSRL